MIPTDEVRPVTSSLIDLREVPLTTMAALGDESLRRILAGVQVTTPALPFSFNSSI